MFEVKKGLRELSAFNAGLKTMSTETLATVVAFVADQRNGYFEEGIDLGDPIAFCAVEPQFANEQRKVAKVMVAGDANLAAVSSMVWMHTLNAAKYPALRDLAKAMWRELQRGVPHVNEASTEYRDSSGRSLNTTGAGQIPKGFE